MEAGRMWGWGQPVWPCHPGELRTRIPNNLGGRYHTSGRIVPYEGDQLRAFLAASVAKGMTLEHLGRLTGVSRERIRQLIRRVGIDPIIARTVRRRRRWQQRVACGVAQLPKAIQEALSEQVVIPRTWAPVIFEANGIRFNLHCADKVWRPAFLSSWHPGYWHFSSPHYPPDVDYVVFLVASGTAYVVPRAAVPRSANIPAGFVLRNGDGRRSDMDWDRYVNAWPWLLTKPNPK